MSNSSLVNYTRLSPNHSGARKHSIDRITPHCVVGQVSVETLGNIFASPARQASCNYGIGTDGRVILCVEEKNRSWCSSSSENDNRAVTIECASDNMHPYAFNNAVYSKLVTLCVDICKRNGKNKLIWIPDKNSALNYTPAPNEMLLTVHRWFKNKACPGDWLMARMGELASSVTAQLNPASPAPATSEALYRVQVGAFSKKANAVAYLDTIHNLGYKDAIIKNVNGMFKVQLGAFSKKANAEALRDKVVAQGLQAIITQDAGTVASPVHHAPVFRVGNDVQIKQGAKTYDGKSLASYVYARTYLISQLKGDRAVLTYNGTVVAAVRVSDLILV